MKQPYPETPQGGSFFPIKLGHSLGFELKHIYMQMTSAYVYRYACTFVNAWTFIYICVCVYTLNTNIYVDMSVHACMPCISSSRLFFRGTQTVCLRWISSSLQKREPFLTKLFRLHCEYMATRRRRLLQIKHPFASILPSCLW